MSPRARALGLALALALALSACGVKGPPRPPEQAGERPPPAGVAPHAAPGCGDCAVPASPPASNPNTTPPPASGERAETPHP